jgi:protein-S-isoprenylcysteine O-methyltransferase
MVAVMGGYLGVAIALMWPRVDAVAAASLAFSVALGFEHLSFARRLGSDDVRQEAFGTGYDPGMAKWISALSLAELAVFVDFGHMGLAPALEWAPLRWAGLALYAAALAWLRWTDRYLARHFAAGGEREVIARGPFRFVRHPRYAGLVASRVAFALAFGSAVAYALVPLWVGVVLRRIRLEEAHLDDLFGDRYRAYAAATARLLPGVY